MMGIKSLMHKKRIAHFLQQIPQSNQPFAPMKQFITSDEPADILPTLWGVVQMLMLWGIVELHQATSSISEAQIRASSQAAKYMLESLAQYLLEGLPLVADWETRGVQRDKAFDQILESGATLLYLLEQRRLKHTPNARPSRYVKVAQALIIRIHPENGQKEILMQYDDNAQQYQLIGGRWRESDGTNLKLTLIREIEEELAASQLAYPEDYQIQLLAEGVEIGQVLSPTFGALTNYQFWIYHVHSIKRPLQLTEKDAWISLDAFQRGRINGLKITELFATLNQAIKGGLEQLPTSFN